MVLESQVDERALLSRELSAPEPLFLPMSSKTAGAKLCTEEAGFGPYPMMQGERRTWGGISMSPPKTPFQVTEVRWNALVDASPTFSILWPDGVFANPQAPFAVHLHVITEDPPAPEAIPFASYQLDPGDLAVGLHEFDVQLEPSLVLFEGERLFLQIEMNEKASRTGPPSLNNYAACYADSYDLFYGWEEGDGHHWDQSLFRMTPMVWFEGYVALD
jgi:hypothetical protein